MNYKKNLKRLFKMRTFLWINKQKINFYPNIRKSNNNKVYLLNKQNNLRKSINNFKLIINIWLENQNLQKPNKTKNKDKMKKFRQTKRQIKLQQKSKIKLNSIYFNQYLIIYFLCHLYLTFLFLIILWPFFQLNFDFLLKIF